MSDFNLETNKYFRRKKLCIGYKVSFNRITRDYYIRFYSVQNDRTSAFLGCLKMKADEWLVLHPFIYEKMEDLSPPIYENEESD